jgi:hypothetical protein
MVADTSALHRSSGEQYLVPPMSAGRTSCLLKLGSLRGIKGRLSPMPAARTRCLRKAGSLRGIQGEVVVPLPEGDKGGGKIIRTPLHSWMLVDCCCSTDFSSTAEHHNPLRSVACRQRNASPLMKGDKVLNVGSTSIQLPNTITPCVPLLVSNGTRPP